MKKVMSAVLTAAIGAGLVVSVPCFAEEEKDPFIVLPYSSIETCDPYAISGCDKTLQHQIYDFLFQYDENGEAVPCLVESWEISEDGKEYTFHLREDVTFHDGSAFNADDVIFAYETMLGTANESTLLNVAASMEKVDDYTVVMEKGSSYASVFNFFCEFMPIVESESYAADTEKFASNPIGTGAYKLERMDETSGYVYLVANEDYFEGAPEVKEIEIHTPLDSSVALVALENGEVDYTNMLNNSDLELAAENENLKVENTDSWSQKTVCMFGEPMNSDENLRKAIYYGINRENAAIYNGETEIVTAENAFSERLMGDYAGQYDIGGYDPDLAAEYLAKSSYTGETIEINVTSDMEQIAVSMQADLDAIGIKTTVNLLDTNTWSSKLLDGTLQLTCADYGVAYSSTEEMLSYFATSGFYGSMGLVATSEACDKATDALKDIWNDEERYDAAIEALKAHTDLAILVPLFGSNFYACYSAEYDNVEPVWAATYCPYFSRMTYAE